MSFKAWFLVLLIILFGVFLYLKIQLMGDQNSNFNKTTRFSLAKYGILRTILGLHSVGESRYEYLKSSTSEIDIEWFKPQSENDDSVNKDLMDKFAGLVSSYTGRTAKAVYGGPLSDGTIKTDNLEAYKVKTGILNPGASVMMVFFTKDYSPRPDNELSTTYQDFGMILSLDSHRNFLQSYPQYLNQYLFASLLHEFGNQIGMNENPSPEADPSCIMNLHAGFEGSPLEASGKSEPQDFCPAEQTEISNLKLQFGK